MDKLVTQLKNQKECEDAAMSTAKKKHASEVRAMQQKVRLPDLCIYISQSQGIISIWVHVSIVPDVKWAMTCQPL